MTKSKTRRNGRIPRKPAAKPEAVTLINSRGVLFELPSILSDVQLLQVHADWLNQFRALVGQLKGQLAGEDFLCRIESATRKCTEDLSSRERRLQYYRMLLTLRRLIPVAQKRRVALLGKVEDLTRALSFAADERPDTSSERLLFAASVLRRASATCKRAHEALERGLKAANSDATNGKGEDVLYKAFRAVCADPEGAELGGEDILLPFKVIPGLGYDFITNASFYVELENVIGEIVPPLVKAMVAAYRLEQIAPCPPGLSAEDLMTVHIMAMAFKDGPSDAEKAKIPALRDELESFLIWQGAQEKRIVHAITAASHKWRKYGRDPNYLWAVNVVVGAAQVRRSLVEVRDLAVRLLYGNLEDRTVRSFCRRTVREVEGRRLCCPSQDDSD